MPHGIPNGTASDRPPQAETGDIGPAGTAGTLDVRRTAFIPGKG